MTDEGGLACLDWRATEYPGYAVNAQGDVLGPRGKILRQKLRGKGYPSVRVTGDRTVYVHRLVCTAFNGPPPSEEHQVAHRNGKPADNRAVNLRWSTRAGNTRDAVAHGTSRLKRGGEGEANGHARLTWEQAEEIRSLFTAGRVTQAALAARFGVGKSQVHNIVRGKQWATREEWRP